jgi:NADPH-dependent ferric siderophore reductase
MSQANLGPIQASLVVSRKVQITPHYIRVFLTGEDVLKFVHATVGVNNKILIPPKGIHEVHFPEFDYEKKQWKPMPDEIRPTVRTYTHRGIDPDKKELWIDFATHGEEGPASSWAIHAREGDALGVLMKSGKKELYTRAENYLLAGDATAIPVLGAILEDLPATAKAVCIIEVQSKEDEQLLSTKADVTFIWLHNPDPLSGSQLAETLKAQQLPATNRFAYIAAEFSSVKAIRSFLRKDQGWLQEELYAYSYWKAGVAEDQSAGERRQEKNNE